MQPRKKSAGTPRKSACASRSLRTSYRKPSGTAVAHLLVSLRRGVLTLPTGSEKMYKDGGLFSVTSRILIVDMLKKTIPVHLITGLVVLHAEE